MGVSDQFLIPNYKLYLKNHVLNRDNLKIAWLGQQDPSDPAMGNLKMFHALSDIFGDNCDHHFFDIANKNSWDVHDEWNLQGFDLVLCFRLTFLVQSSRHLLEQIKKTVEKNKVFISDFVTGNIVNGVIGWKSNNLVCYLPKYYSHLSEKEKNSLSYKVTHKDHLLDQQALDDHSLSFREFIAFRGPKKRHYIITKVAKKDEY